MVHLARLARLQDDARAQTRAFADEVMVHRGDRQQRRDRRAARADRAVGEDDDVDLLRDRVVRLRADALQRLLHPGHALGHGPGDVDRARREHVVRDVAQRLELPVEQDRLAEDQLVRVLGRLVEEVALGPERGRQAHHDFLADRVDRRVGDLREELLEVGEQRRRLVGEHGQREVVAHRADRLLPFARHRGEQHPQVLLAVAEGALARVQRLVGDRDLVRARQVGEVHRVARDPLAVGAARGDRALDLAVLDDAAALQVDQEQLAGLQASQAPHALGRDVEQAGLRAQHDEPVDRLDPAPGAQAVAVERRAHDAAIRERDRRGAVPGLHQAGVEGVEAFSSSGRSSRLR